MEAHEESSSTLELGVKRTSRLVSCGLVPDCRKQDALDVSDTR